MEPIARLSLEGGYDSNPLYDGLGADRVGRVSPELGLRLHDPLYLASLSWRGDWLVYDKLAPNGIWNHRGDLKLDARLTRRLDLHAALRGSWAFDPLGLAQLGVFRTGRQSALVVTGSARTLYRLTPVADLAGTLAERTVRFEDGTGGAMHAPGVEALYHASRRLALGGAYSLGIFQAFNGPAVADELSWSHALRARARWRATRRVTLDAYAGPATWFGKNRYAIVPEASVQALVESRGMGVRLSASHGLGIGSTARPGLVDAIEFGAERHFGDHRRWMVRGDGGIWHSGRAPSGGDAVTGWAAGGEVGRLVGMNVRLSLAATHFARLDDPSPALRRTTVGLRLGWEMPVH
ncbi:MAG TPA: hypothetical protein VFK90_07995 [Anaeromyxobacter sp.]|nr:hypothetical protein [Anaeromyxobacter sp.]